VTDELSGWAEERAPELLARAEAEAVAVIRDALVAAALAGPRRPTPAKGRRAAAAAEPPREGSALWAYCVVGADRPAPDPTLTGVAGGPVTRVEAGALAALVSRVPLSEFAAEPLRANLNDLDWLERVARAHEEVLDAALAGSTIVPLRLCTIYQTEDGVREMLERESRAMLEVLARLEDHQEWAVKLFVDRAELEREARSRSPDASALEAELEASTGGGAYILRRRLEREIRAEADRLAGELAEDVHARLVAATSAAITLRAQNRELSGREGEMLLNGAYLVEAARVDRLTALVSELDEHHRALGARVELTGPWPPYNFVTPDGAAIA
jgi:gas vesicle protein GvpL/GvpF